MSPLSQGDGPHLPDAGAGVLPTVSDPDHGAALIILIKIIITKTTITSRMTIVSSSKELIWTLLG